MSSKAIAVGWAVAALGSVWITAGCQRVRYSAEEQAKYVKPTIAVMSFKNRAQVTTKWNLGDALADELIDRLLQTKRYEVLEREQLAAIFTELGRTSDDRFRQAGQPDKGKLKHAQYHIKGVITDFGHVETVEGIWRILDWGWFGSSSHSVVRAVVRVVDVQSGQVIASESVEAKVRDKKDHDKINLDGMTFASYTFYQSSLGQATSKMLDKAVWAIAKSIAERPFQPKISSIVNDQVVISGGRNRRISVGNMYSVRPQSQVVVDPDSGDVLGHISGKVIGKVQITQVTEKYSIAKVVQGSGFAVGQTLFLNQPVTTDSSAASSSY